MSAATLNTNGNLQPGNNREQDAFQQHLAILRQNAADARHQATQNCWAVSRPAPASKLNRLDRAYKVAHLAATSFRAALHR